VGETTFQVRDIGSLPRFGPTAMQWAVALSLVLHGALPLLLRRASHADRAAAAARVEATDRWTGSSPNIPTEGLIDVGPGRQRPAPAKAAEPEKRTAAEPPARPTDQASVDPKAEEPARPAKPAKPAEPVSTGEAVPDSSTPSEPRPPRPPRRAAAGREATGASGAGAERGGGGTFGSEGAAGVRSLGRAFTRAIPIAGQADPMWGSLPTGSAGSVELTLAVDENGRLDGTFHTKDPNPPAHLKILIQKTLVLLQAGTYAIHAGELAKGRETLRLRASVSDVTGDAAAEGLGIKPFENGRGVAAFTQTGGRHVEIAVEVVRIQLER
jgi:hypothetical protein